MALTDEQLRAFIPRTNFLVDKSYFPTVGEEETEVTTSYGIPNTNAFINSGGGEGALQVGDPMLNYDNYYNYTGNKYMMKQPRPNLDIYSDNAQKTFMGFPSYKEQELTGADMGEYIGSGTNIPLELTGAGKIQSSIEDAKGGIKNLMGMLPTPSSLLNRLGIQNFNSLSPADQLFIKTHSGYRGPTVFGENTSGLNKDVFGMNVESLFGNYAQGVRDSYDQLKNTLTKESRAKDGVTFNEATGMFESDILSPQELEAYNKNTNMIRNKFVFRKKQIDQQNKNQRDIDKKAAMDAEIAAAESRKKSEELYDPNVHGDTNYGLGADNQQSYANPETPGIGWSATGSGPVSNKTGKGRQDWARGGILGAF